MKLTNLFARNLLLGLAAIVATAMTSQAVADSIPQTITVTRIHGEARYTMDNRTWQSLKAGDVLKPGCVIQTAPKSYVDILFGERSAVAAIASHGPPSPSSASYSPEEPRANAVRIFENSALAVDKLTVDRTGTGEELSDTQLDLRAGQILGNVKKLSAASKYEVKIPNGVAGIRGTVYFINSSGVVTVITGSVVVAIVGPDGTVITRVVSAGQRYNPDTNTISQIPREEERLLRDIVQILNIPPSPPTGPVPGTPILYVSPN